MGSNLKYLSFLRLRYSRGAKKGWPTRRLKGESEDTIWGFTAQVTLEKVKQDGTMRPGTVMQFPFIHGYGFHYAKYLFDKGRAEGLIKVAGKKWTIGSLLTFTGGRAQVDDWIYDTPDEAEKVLKTLFETADPEPEEDDDERTDTTPEPKRVSTRDGHIGADTDEGTDIVIGGSSDD